MTERVISFGHGQKKNPEFFPDENHSNLQYFSLTAGLSTFFLEKSRRFCRDGSTFFFKGKGGKQTSVVSFTAIEH